MLDVDEEAWVKEYSSAVLDSFGSLFTENAHRLPQGERLISRFKDCVGLVLSRGRAYFRGVDEAHNELCIAAALLKDPSDFVKIIYEPTLPGTEKSIDFCCEAATAAKTFVDVKTMKPAPKDRWDTYERALDEGWFPKHVGLILKREWLGGELWHHAFTARDRMLEHTVALEEKILKSGLSDSGAVFILALCGEGFHWHQDELEDFVAFYRTGQHRADDPFASVEIRRMEERNVSLLGSIASFACMSRRQGDLDYRSLTWNVQPPRDQ